MQLFLLKNPILHFTVSVQLNNIFLRHFHLRVTGICTHMSSNSSQYPYFCYQPRNPVSFLHSQILCIYGMLFAPTIHIPKQH